MKEEYFFKSRCVPIEARSSRDSTACYEKHTHEEFSIGVIESGEAEFDLAGRVEVITPGSVVTMNPNVVHSCNPVEASWSYKMLYISPAWLQEVLKTSGVVTLEDLYLVDIAHTKSLTTYKCFQKLFAEVLKAHDQDAIKPLLIKVVAELYDGTTLLVADNHRVINQDTYSAGDSLLLARDYIMEHCAESLSIIKIAEMVGMSQYHLIRSFRRRFGITPHAFQIAQKVCKGRKMLASGMGISAAAIGAGFSDQSHFHRNFKKMVAATPNCYKNDTYS